MSTAIVSLHADEWIIVNDDVMGGRSTGAVHNEGDRLVFSGALNTKGGGFASIRSDGLNGSLSSANGIIVRVLGDGRAYACDLRDAPRVSGSGVSWKVTFKTELSATTDIRLPFSAFVPTWRGRVLSLKELGRPTPFRNTAGSIGFTISDKTDGPFRLEVLSIAAF